MPVNEFIKPEAGGLSYNLEQLYAAIRRTLETSENILDVRLSLPPEDPEHPSGPLNIAIEVNGWTRTFALVHRGAALLNELRRTFCWTSAHTAPSRMCAI